MSEAEEVSAALERILVKLALLGRSHQVLVYALASAARSLLAAGMTDEAEEAATALAQANAILEEAKG